MAEDGVQAAAEVGLAIPRTLAPPNCSRNIFAKPNVGLIDADSEHKCFDVVTSKPPMERTRAAREQTETRKVALPSEWERGSLGAFGAWNALTLGPVDFSLGKKGGKHGSENQFHIG
jgi:hypothetical protein